MLEGLEISVVKFSQLKIENGELRIDAEYFSKTNLSLMETLDRYGCIKISDAANSVTDGIHDSIDYDETSKINLISAGSPKDNIFDLSRSVFISEKAHKENPRTALKKNDVVISTVGTIGNCAVVDETILPANSDRHVGIIRLNLKKYSPYVLSTFLLSKYGRMQTLRESTGNVQLNLFLYKIRELKIPIFSDSFQSQIETLVKSAHAKLEQSKSLYFQAEKLLLDELGLSHGFDFANAKSSAEKVPCDNISIKKFSDFTASGRLDAEYYQKKYDEIEKAIKSYKGGFDIVSNLFKQNTDVCDYKKTEYNYIEIGDVNVGDGSVSFNKVETAQLPDNAKRVLYKNDILISKVRPYRGAVAIINFEQNDLIGSGAFTVLQEKSSYKKETLQILFRTAIYKDWLLKWNVGSSYPVIKDEDILNLPIPILPQAVQTQIASLIQESFDCKKESKQLLETAKKLVEDEIER